MQHFAITQKLINVAMKLHWHYLNNFFLWQCEYTRYIAQITAAAVLLTTVYYWLSFRNAASTIARSYADILYGHPVDVVGTAILHSMCSAGTQQISFLCGHWSVCDGPWSCM